MASRPARIGLFLVILGAGAWLRFAFLANHALWVDEIINLERALLPIKDIVASLRQQGPVNITADYCPPLYHLLLHLALDLGRTDLVAKLPGILCGLGVITLTSLMAREFFNTRVAVIVAVLVSLSSYMVYYSRTIRPFSLFLLLSLSALYGFQKAVRDGKNTFWAVYALYSAAALYTLYLYPMNMAGLGVYLLGTGLYDRLAKGQPVPWQTWQTFLLTTLAAVVLYAPWLSAHLFLLELSDVQFPPGQPQSSLGDAFAAVFRDFVLHDGGKPWYAALSLALLLLGCLRAWWTERGRELLLLLLWAVFPLPVYCLLRSSHPFYSRHIITLYFFVVMGIGLGLDAVVAWLAKNRQTLLPLLAAAALATAYSLPNLERLEAFFQSATSFYKDQALQVYLHRANCTYFDSCRPDSLSFIARWYLPRTFKSLATASEQDYKRLYYIDTESTLAVAPGYSSTAVLKNFTTFDHRIGLVNSSPVVLRPMDGLGYGYRDDFRDFRLYLHARRWENLEINREESFVGCSDPARPGSLTYTFDVSEFPDKERADIVLSFLYKKHTLAESDDRCRVEMALDDGPFQPLYSVGIEDFRDLVRPHRSQYVDYRLTRTVSLPGGWLNGASTVSVRCVFNPGLSLSAIRLSEFAFGVTGRPAPATPDPAERLLENIRRNTRLASWPEAETYALDRPLTAFALSPEAAAAGRDGVGTPEDLRAFLRQHPGARPVHELADGSGRPRYAFFDPFLDAVLPRLAAPGTVPVRFADPTARVAGIEARGSLRLPEVALGDASLPLGLWLPKGSLVSLAAGAPVRAFFLPDFRASSFDPQQFFLAERIRQNGEEPCLRCQDGEDCWFTYLFASATPIQELRLTYFPRLFRDPAGKNRITVQYSDDFKTFHDLETLQSDGEGGWTEHERAHTLRIPLRKSARQAWIRFLLASDGCQVWASPKTPTCLTATFAGEAFAPVSPDAAATALGVAFDAPSDFTLRLSGDGAPFPAAVLRH